MNRSDIEFWHHDDVTRFVMRQIEERCPVNFYKTHCWDDVMRQKGRQDVISLLSDLDSLVIPEGSYGNGN